MIAVLHDSSLKLGARREWRAFSEGYGQAQRAAFLLRAIIGWEMICRLGPNAEAMNFQGGKLIKEKS